MNVRALRATPQPALSPTASGLLDIARVSATVLSRRAFCKRPPPHLRDPQHVADKRHPKCRLGRSVKFVLQKPEGISKSKFHQRWQRAWQGSDTIVRGPQIRARGSWSSVNCETSAGRDSSTTGSQYMVWRNKYVKCCPCSLSAKQTLRFSSFCFTPSTNIGHHLKFEQVRETIHKKRPGCRRRLLSPLLRHCRRASRERVCKTCSKTILR